MSVYLINVHGSNDNHCVACPWHPDRYSVFDSVWLSSCFKVDSRCDVPMLAWNSYQSRETHSNTCFTLARMTVTTLCVVGKIWVPWIPNPIFTDRVRSTREGYVLTRVCPSVCPHLRGGGYPSQVQVGGGTPARSSWGYPDWGTPLWVPPCQTWQGGTPMGGYPTSGTPPPVRIGRGVPHFEYYSGWPQHRENREFGCSFFQTGKTQGICQKIFKIWFYTGNLTRTQGKFWSFKTERYFRVAVGCSYSFLIFWSKCWVGGGGGCQTNNGITFLQLLRCIYDCSFENNSSYVYGQGSGIDVIFWSQKAQGKSWKHREISGKIREFWLDQSVAALVLDTPRSVCLLRSRRRTFLSFGKSRSFLGLKFLFTNWP